MIPPSRPLSNLALGAVTDTSAELFLEIQRARVALEQGKLAKAERIASTVLSRATTRAPAGRRQNPSPAAPESETTLVAAAMSILGLVAHRQRRPVQAEDLLRTAVLLRKDLARQGLELDAPARAEFVQALLLTGQGEQAVAAVRQMVESGFELPVRPVLAVADWLREQGRPREEIEILDTAHLRRPDEPDLSVALARALTGAGRTADAAQAHVEAAVLLAGQDDLAGAEHQFRQALQVRPGFTGAVAGLTQILLRQDRVEEAIEIVAPADAGEDRSPETAALHAAALAVAGRREDALEVAETAAAELGDSPVLLEVSVLLLAQAGRYRDALAAVRRALELDRDDAEMQLLEARLLLDTGQPEEAVGILDRLREELPDSAEVLAVSARALAEVGRDDEAAAAMREAIRTAPDADEIAQEREWLVEKWTSFASERLSRLDDPEVRPALERALSVDQESSTAHAMLGEILRQEGRYDEALEHLERARRKGPDSGWVVGTIGQVLSALGRPEAIENLQRAASLDDSLPWVHTELADAYRVAGRPHNALRAVDRALELDPKDPWPWAIKGATQSLLGDWEDALTCLDRALALKPDYGWALAVKASLLTDIAETGDALRAVQAAIDADPTMSWAWGLKARLLNWLEGDATEEEAAARRALAIAPDDLYLHIVLGESLLRRGRDQEAEESFRQAVALFGGSPVTGADPDPLYNVAWAQLRLGDFEAALSFLGAAAAQDSGRIGGVFTLALALLCAGRTAIALGEYDRAIRRAVAEPHAGRRRAVLWEARHDVQQLLRQERLKDEPQVRQVLDRLAKAAGESAAPRPS